MYKKFTGLMSITTFLFVSFVSFFPSKNQKANASMMGIIGILKRIECDELWAKYEAAKAKADQEEWNGKPGPVPPLHGLSTLAYSNWLNAGCKQNK